MQSFTFFLCAVLIGLAASSYEDIFLRSLESSIPDNGIVDKQGTIEKIRQRLDLMKEYYHAKHNDPAKFNMLPDEGMKSLVNRLDRGGVATIEDLKQDCQELMQFGPTVNDMIIEKIRNDGKLGMVRQYFEKGLKMMAEEDVQPHIADVQFHIADVQPQFGGVENLEGVESQDEFDDYPAPRSFWTSDYSYILLGLVILIVITGVLISVCDCCRQKEGRPFTLRSVQIVAHPKIGGGPKSDDKIGLVA